MTGYVSPGQGVDLLSLSRNPGILLGSDPSGQDPEQSGLELSEQTALILVEVGVLPSVQVHRVLSNIRDEEQGLNILNLKCKDKT